MEANYFLIRLISITTLVYIIRLIYTHKLKIGHSWLLLVLGIGFIVLSIWPDTIKSIQYITGDHSLLVNIVFFLIAFLFLITIHCSVMISQLTSNLKELGQELAIISSEINEEKMKREAVGAHAITAATVLPEIENELRKVAAEYYKEIKTNHPAVNDRDLDNASKGKSEMPAMTIHDQILETASQEDHKVADGSIIESQNQMPENGQPDQYEQ